jgi:tRNA-2-methylthio-N6-dimethylallyladenosine synthase
MATRERGSFKDTDKYRESLIKKFSWITHVLDIRLIKRLPLLLDLDDIPFNEIDYMNMSPPLGDSVIAKIPISTGCDFFCSYCIVPYTRGRLYNRAYDEIINDVRNAISRGAKLIYLIGQNVNSWRGLKERKAVSFDVLLNDVAKISSDVWITFVSSNPMDFTDSMIDSIASNTNVVRWLNLALQSGSDKVLRAMNRKYSVADYKELVRKVKKRIPDIRLTTDMIVGFPTENEDDFVKSVDIVKELEFDMVYLGKYSPRKGTVADLQLSDTVPFDVKRKRFHELEAVVNSVRLKHHQKYLGSKIKILTTGSRKGMSIYNHEAVFDSILPESMRNIFVTAEVYKVGTAGIDVRLVK